MKIFRWVKYYFAILISPEAEAEAEKQKKKKTQPGEEAAEMKLHKVKEVRL